MVSKREAISAQADATLLKEIIKLIHRIERILVPPNSLVHSTIGERLDGLIVRIKKGEFFQDVNKFPLDDLIGYDAKSIEPLFRQVAWEKLHSAIWLSVSDGNESYELPSTVLNEIGMEQQVHDDKLQKAANKERVRRMQQRNGLPVMPGKWRKEPYSSRTYDFLTDYVVTHNISDEEGQQLKSQLNTPLEGFLGQAYNYDDHGLTEEWMVSFQDKAAKGPSDDEVIRTQLESLLEIMLYTVQDRVCTETGVLQRPYLELGKDVKEVPVWGMDCYTRRMVEMSIEDRVPSERRTEGLIRTFVERRLLPTINDQHPSKAHDMTNSIQAIINSSVSSPIDIEYAEAVLAAIREYTIDVFRIHPKGTGVVCINPAGIQPHVFVTPYLGEMYPPYRWCERLDVVEQAQQTFELKPTLPDFWNILLERPRQDPNGYGLLYVDASRRANLGSSCSHSCDSNCTSAVVSRNGKLLIALTTNRYVHYGEELTMDYYSITTSDVEWRAAICLCGSAACRGSFLHYATQDDLQQVLNQSCGPLWRYASLLRACSERPISADDADVLVRHGMQSVALGTAPPVWMKKYAVDNLKFVEFERKALPCALLRSKDGSKSLYTFSAADMDARSVMEQRLQSMVCCFSMVTQVLQRNEVQNGTAAATPLVPYLPGAAVSRVWEKLQVIPGLLRTHLYDPAKVATCTAQLTYLQNISKIEAAKVSAGSPCSSTSVASSKENTTAKSHSGVEGNSSTSNVDYDKTLQQKRTASEEILEAIAEVEGLLVVKPAGLTKLREIILAIRTAVLRLTKFSTAKARIEQLVDILVFWAYTGNFSTVQNFGAVESGPIEVYARELGTNIPRSKIFKHYRGDTTLSLRSRAAGAPAVVGSTDSLTAALDGLPISTSDPDLVQLQQGSLTVRTSPDCAPSTGSAAEASGCTTQASSDLSVTTTIPVEVSPTASKAAVDGSSETSTETISAANTVSISESCVISTMGEQSREFLVNPDETVFSGTKKYSELFTFWQLMGWFNAGTDQKTEAPDLFGCVELPEPSFCFGTAEVAYGAKQRESLIALLRDDKQQTMSWPAVLKQSFTLPAPESCSKSPLYGSPMLDGALGQVGMVAKVITALLETHTASTTVAVDGKKKKGSGKDTKESSSTGKKSKNADKDVTQFDSILPPEMPTSWVQCELCRKWRRVAWFVDSETLPDLWECPMNTWDPENATCAAPQDGYDPDAENTLGFGTTEVAVDESQFTVGKKFDVFCNRNKVYYEASVLKVKKNPKRPNEAPKAMFRYVGWGTRFDELISIDSDRIAPHNLHTNPLTKNPREQEKWQGAKNLFDDGKSVLVNAFKATKPKTTAKSTLPEETISKKRGRQPKKAVSKAAAAVSPPYCDDFEDLDGEDLALGQLFGEEGESPDKKPRGV